MTKHRIVMLKAYVSATLWLVSHAAFAHHSFVAEFDYNLSGTVEGVVTEIFFRQPHVQYYVKTTNENGEEELWATSTLNPNALFRRGWTKNMIRVGDKVILRGNLGRNNTKMLRIRSVELEDGSVIMPKPGGIVR